MAEDFGAQVTKFAVSRQHPRGPYKYKKKVTHKNFALCPGCLIHDTYQFDHMAAQRLGGASTIENCAPFCDRCHQVVKTRYYEADMANFYGLPPHDVLKSNNYMHPVGGKLIFIKWDDPSKPFPLAGMGWPLEKEYLNFINRAIFNMTTAFRWFCFRGMGVQGTMREYFETPKEFMPVPIRSIKDLKTLDATYQPLLETLEICYYLTRVPTGFLNAGLQHHATTRSFQPYEKRQGVAEFLNQDYLQMISVATPASTRRWVFENICYDFRRCVSAMLVGNDLKSYLESFLNKGTENDRERFLKLIKVKASADFPCLPHIPMLDAFPEDQKDSTCKKEVCFELFQKAISRPVDIDRKNLPLDDPTRLMHEIDNYKLKEWELMISKPDPNELHGFDIDKYEELERLQKLRKRLLISAEYIRFLDTITSLDQFVADVQAMINCLDVTTLLERQGALLEACVAHLEAQTPPTILTPITSPVRMQQWPPMSSPERSPSPELKTVTLPKENLLAERETLKRRRDEVAKEALELEYKIEINSLEVEFVLKKEKIDQAYGRLEQDDQSQGQD